MTSHRETSIGPVTTHWCAEEQIDDWLSIWEKPRELAPPFRREQTSSSVFALHERASRECCCYFPSPCRRGRVRVGACSRHALPKIHNAPYTTFPLRPGEGADFFSAESFAGAQTFIAGNASVGLGSSSPSQTSLLHADWRGARVPVFTSIDASADQRSVLQ
jgi:hypothetical protein